MVAIIKKPLILLILLFVIAVGGAAYFYNQNQNAQNELQQLKENPRAAVVEETKKLIGKVGTLVDLPQGEDPTLATITDVKKLKDQAFFAKSENGDKVLIYTQAKRAILYRPSTNKVIDIAPVNIGTESAPKALQNLVKVALYNGTDVVGLTYTIEANLKAEMDNISVVLKENAEKNDYTKTLVIDLSGKQSENAKKIAQILGGEVGSLPAGETKPDSADILVILGR